MTTQHPATFGDIIRRRRHEMGLSQEELAGRSGLSVRRIGDLERGARARPHRDTLRLLSDALDLSDEERANFEVAARTLQPHPSPPDPDAGSGSYSSAGSDRNLPAQLTSFIGRERELGAVGEIFLRPEVRLVTLTGPGGIGKTRLAQQVASELLADFSDGVYFISLAPITDPDLVVSVVAQELGVVEAGGRPLLEGVKRHLGRRKMLLVLDNFEQVISAAPALAEILAACPHLKLLVTSRAPLHLYGEREFPVPTLSLPNHTQIPPVEEIEQYEAVRLYVDRAQAAKPSFALTNENATAVVELCRRLDGLPLAIELAAARIKALSPAALLARLETRLPLLTGGPTDLPARHQTLRNTIAWSHDLLSKPEQALFRRLAVFVGGCPLDAAEAVVDDPPLTVSATGSPTVDVLDVLASLVDKSLLLQEEVEGAEPRFRMLETVREYAQERLADSGEAGTIHRRHATYYLALAEQAASNFRGPQQGAWLDRVEVEHDNMRAALAWGRAAASGPGDDAEVGLRLAAALWWFWYSRGYFSEGRRWLEDLLVHTNTIGRETSPAVRAEAMLGVGALAVRQGDHARARSWLEESLRLWRELGGGRGLTYALLLSGFVWLQRGDYGAACARLAEGVGLLREQCDTWGLAYGLNPLGRALLKAGLYPEARSCFEESLPLFRQMGDKWGITLALLNLGDVGRRQGEYGEAQRLLEEALAMRAEVGDRWHAALVLMILGDVARHQGDYAQAARRYSEQLELFRELGSTWYLAECVRGLAAVRVAQAQPEEAARLLGAVEAVLASTGHVLSIADRAEHDQIIADVRSKLGEPAFAAAWSEGRALSIEAAVELALEEAEHAAVSSVTEQSRQPAAAAANTVPERSSPLSPREREVAALLARGLTNREIAERLVISERTADTHVVNILNKLGFHSRTQIAVWAAEQRLATSA